MKFITIVLSLTIFGAVYAGKEVSFTPEDTATITSLCKEGKTFYVLCDDSKVEGIYLLQDFYKIPKVNEVKKLSTRVYTKTVTTVKIEEKINTAVAAENGCVLVTFVSSDENGDGNNNGIINNLKCPEDDKKVSGLLDLVVNIIQVLSRVTVSCNVIDANILNNFLNNLEIEDLINIDLFK